MEINCKSNHKLSKIPLSPQSKKIKKIPNKLPVLSVKKIEANLILNPLKNLVDKKKQHKLDLCLQTIRQDISIIKNLFGHDEQLFFLNLINNDIASGSLGVRNFRDKEAEKTSQSQWKKIYFHCLLDQKFKISCKSRLYKGGKFKDLNNFLNHPMVKFFHSLLEGLLDESTDGTLDYKCLINLLQYGDKEIAKYLNEYIIQSLPAWPNIEQWNQFKNNNPLESSWSKKIIQNQESNLFYSGMPYDPAKNIEIKKLIFAYILHQMQWPSIEKSDEVTFAMILPYPPENRPIVPIIHFEIIVDHMYPYDKSLEMLSEEKKETFMDLNPRHQFLLTAKYIMNCHRALDVFQYDRQKTQEIAMNIKSFINFHTVILNKSFQKLPLYGYQQVLCTIASYLLPSHWSFKTIYDLFFNNKMFWSGYWGENLIIDDH
jgi:hypothetical protein